MAQRIYIAGRGGRIGSEIARLATAGGMALVERPEDAGVALVATPGRAAGAILDGLPRGVVGIDLSGALKARGAGRYALLADDGALPGGPPRPGERLANPGCIASAVILGLRRSGVAGALDGPAHVSAIGGASMAHRSQSGALRLARRLGDHPHRAEIERALPGVALASFAPAVAYGTERGILSVISGRVRPGWQPASGGETELDAAMVAGTDRVLWRLEVQGRDFTLGVVLDNLTFPAANAVRVAALVGAQ